MLGRSGFELGSLVWSGFQLGSGVLTITPQSPPPSPVIFNYSVVLYQANRQTKLKKVDKRTGAVRAPFEVSPLDKISTSQFKSTC